MFTVDAETSTCCTTTSSSRHPITNLRRKKHWLKHNTAALDAVKIQLPRVILVPGTGNITINKKSIEEYIPFAYLHEVIKQPLNLTETLGSYDV